MKHRLWLFLTVLCCLLVLGTAASASAPSPTIPGGMYLDESVGVSLALDVQQQTATIRYPLGDRDTLCWQFADSSFHLSLELAGGHVDLLCQDLGAGPGLTEGTYMLVSGGNTILGAYTTVYDGGSIRFETTSGQSLVFQFIDGSDAQIKLSMPYADYTFSLIGAGVLSPVGVFSYQADGSMILLSIHENETYSLTQVTGGELTSSIGSWMQNNLTITLTDVNGTSLAPLTLSADGSALSLSGNILTRQQIK